MKKFLLVLCFLLALTGCNSGQDFRPLVTDGSVADVSRESGITSPVTFHIIYDNYLKNSGLKADWGFSVLVTGLSETVLLHRYES